MGNDNRHNGTCGRGQKMSERRYKMSLLRVYLYYAFAYFYLWMPTWVIYLQKRRGLGLSQATFIDSLFEEAVRGGGLCLTGHRSRPPYRGALRGRLSLPL